jgi:hypothetical protein
MATTKKTTDSVAIEIPQLKMETAIIHVVGDTPLIVHKWSEKAKKEIRDKQMKKATTKKEAKDPVADFIDTLYWLEGEPEEKTEEAFTAAINNGARFGFPATGFKQCAIMGAYRLGADIKTTVAKAAIIIPCEYIEIKGKAVTMREDMVKVGGISKVADIRYRAQIEDWEADIPVKYVSSVMSLEQVINLFNLGGFACGVGEWRNEKNGIFGAFHVAKS